MIGEIVLIRTMNREMPPERTEEDRRREAQYGIYFEDVTGYLALYQYSTAADPAKLRAALDDDAVWAKTKELVRIGEIKSENPEAGIGRTVRRLRVHGGIRIFMGLCSASLAVYTMSMITLSFWGLIALGLYFFADGWIKGITLPRAWARWRRVKPQEGRR